MDETVFLRKYGLNKLYFRVRELEENAEYWETSFRDLWGRFLKLEAKLSLAEKTEKK